MIEFLYSGKKMDYYSLLNVKPVFGFVKRYRMAGFQNFVCNFFASVGRKTVRNQNVGWSQL
jgi:hypothetical protein